MTWTTTRTGSHTGNSTGNSNDWMCEDFRPSQTRDILVIIWVTSCPPPKPCAEAGDGWSASMPFDICWMRQSAYGLVQGGTMSILNDNHHSPAWVCHRDVFSFSLRKQWSNAYLPLLDIEPRLSMVSHSVVIINSWSPLTTMLLRSGLQGFWGGGGGFEQVMCNSLSIISMAVHTCWSRMRRAKRCGYSWLL